MSSEELALVQTYHQTTKHNFYAYARGPGYLDWATQPDPFRRYRGAPLIMLEKFPAKDTPPYVSSLSVGNVPPVPLDRLSLSQLFFDSLAISAWKRAGEVSWALRVNPSSGNLHPTEGYLICGPVDGLGDSPGVYHYTPNEHAMELRAKFLQETWRLLTAELPPNTVLVGLTSIHWREAWKYGERAFRYCQHDVGHAIAAVSIAAAGLGWQATLLDDLGTEQLARLLGVLDPQGAEAEHPDCLLAVYPQGQPCLTHQLPPHVVALFENLAWQGVPNQLSPRQVEWSIIDEVTAVTLKPTTAGAYDAQLPIGEQAPSGMDPPQRLSQVSLRQVIRQRRSAVALDGRTTISQDSFYDILSQTLPSPMRFPFNALPWSPRVHLALFVHRVDDFQPGLYILVRDPEQRRRLASAMRSEFVWEKPTACRDGLELYRLVTGDARGLARQLSCHQDIASDGCFSLCMIADFQRSLDEFGAWFYPRLYWECGAIGQVLYLASEAARVRGTGIGCFFDDPVHSALGFDLHSLEYQSLYHFTTGGPVEDRRLTTLPAYLETPGRLSNV
jgi:SagB-type dehydrogenase family enzyme